MEMTKYGVQRFFQGVYLTGWGYENEWLGSGVGRNKSQAAVNSAQDALTRNNDALQTAVRRKQEMTVHQQFERDQKRAELRRKAEEGDKDSIVELRRILSNDIRIKKKHASKGDEDAAVKLKELVAEEATLAEKFDVKDAKEGKAQTQNATGSEESNGNHSHADDSTNGNCDTTSTKKHKKSKESKQETPKSAKEAKQSNEDFLANIISGGEAKARSTQANLDDDSSWLERERKKKEKEERKKQEKIAKRENKTNAMEQH